MDASLQKTSNENQTHMEDPVPGRRRIDRREYVYNYVDVLKQAVL